MREREGEKETHGEGEGNSWRSEKSTHAHTPHLATDKPNRAGCLLHHQPSGLRIRGGQNEEAKKSETHTTQHTTPMSAQRTKRWDRAVQYGNPPRCTRMGT